MLELNRRPRQLAISLLVFASLFGQSVEDCRVLSDCDDGTVRWTTLPANRESGRPGKRGPPGHPGPKGEPGAGVNVEELKAQLREDDEGPALYFYANTVTWDIGRTFCQSIGKTICSSQQLCVSNGGGMRLIPDVIPNDHWVPVIDSHNEWIQVGSYAKRTCFIHSKHYGKPAWGTSTSTAPHKGYVFCCEDPDISDIALTGMKYQYIGKAATYANSKTHCVSQGLRLCSSTEVCRNNKPQFGMIAGDMWVAVNDKANEWVEIGDNLGRTCWVHGVKYGPPAWGIRADGSLVEHVGYVFCCADNRP